MPEREESAVESAPTSSSPNNDSLSLADLIDDVDSYVSQARWHVADYQVRRYVESGNPSIAEQDKRRAEVETALEENGTLPKLMMTVCDDRRIFEGLSRQPLSRERVQQLTGEGTHLTRILANQLLKDFDKVSAAHDERPALPFGFRLGFKSDNISYQDIFNHYKVSELNKKYGNTIWEKFRMNGVE